MKTNESPTQERLFNLAEIASLQKLVGNLQRDKALLEKQLTEVQDTRRAAAVVAVCIQVLRRR